MAPPRNPRGEPLPPLRLLVVACGPRRSSAYRCSSSVSASGQRGLLGGLPFSSPLRTLVVGFRAHPNLGGLIFRSFAYLITSAKTLFLKKVTFAVPHAHTLPGTPFAVTPGQHRCRQCLLHAPHGCPTNLTHYLPVLGGRGSEGRGREGRGREGRGRMGAWLCAVGRGQFLGWVFLGWVFPGARSPGDGRPELKRRRQNARAHVKPLLFSCPSRSTGQGQSPGRAQLWGEAAAGTPRGGRVCTALPQGRGAWAPGRGALPCLGDVALQSERP